MKIIIPVVSEISHQGPRGVHSRSRIKYGKVGSDGGFMGLQSVVLKKQGRKIFITSGSIEGEEGTPRLFSNELSVANEENYV